mgnify:CR=1 FL=1
MIREDTNKNIIERFPSTEMCIRDRYMDSYKNISILCGFGRVCVL